MEQYGRDKGLVVVLVGDFYRLRSHRDSYPKMSLFYQGYPIPAPFQSVLQNSNAGQLIFFIGSEFRKKNLTALNRALRFPADNHPLAIRST